MNWQTLGQHAWEDPLTFAARFAQEKDFAFLHSGRAEYYTGQQSFLLLEPAYHTTGQRWEDVPTLADTSPLPDWVGYLGYETGTEATIAPATIALPGFWLTRYQRLFCLDHIAKTITEYGRFHAKKPSTLPTATRTDTPLSVTELRSNMPRARYEEIVRATVAAIEEGDFYQANITRKFFGSTAHAMDAFALFARLCAASPAPFSALLKHGAQAVLSSSPESFLQLQGSALTSRPIKGSIRRGANDSEDAALKKALAASGKNLAENLMIVDLMRHDLAQVAQVGSVEVTEQSGLYSYATIHHLISTITAQLRTDATVVDAVRACFPPGSMTGAPKRAAMQWCAQHEGMARGVYSGALGWLSQHACDLSVVIRTLVIDGARFEFQVGGGIVAESDAEDEWHETLVKARGIASALGIDEAALAAL
jgi:para-aminobenzoate synthetase